MRSSISSYIFYDNYGVYGSSKITKALIEGVIVTERTVGRYMKEMGLSAVPKKNFVVTTDSDHENKIFPNTINREFNVEAPNEAWATAITYIGTSQGWLFLQYLCGIFLRL